MKRYIIVPVIAACLALCAAVWPQTAPTEEVPATPPPHALTATQPNIPGLSATEEPIASEEGKGEILQAEPIHHNLVTWSMSLASAGWSAKAPFGIASPPRYAVSRFPVDIYVGYSIYARKQVVIVDEAAETVRLIFTTYVNGSGMKSIVDFILKIAYNHITLHLQTGKTALKALYILCLMGHARPSSSSCRRILIT